MESAGDKSRGGVVRFLIGPAGSGKTSLCLEELRAHEQAGREAFYLVPEQSTYLADRQLLEPPLLAATRHVRALSFRRLAALLDAGGEGRAPRALDRAGRRILLRSLLDSLAPALRSPFEPLLDRHGFLDAMIGVIRDLRFEAGSFPDADIERIEATSSVPQDLQRKLSALLSLRRLYEEALAARNLQDPDLALLGLPERIRRDPLPWAGRPVLVDGFLSFTCLEAETLQRIAEAGASMVITLCLDGALASLLPLVPPPQPPSFRLLEWPRDLPAKVERQAFLAPLRTCAELLARLRAAGAEVEIIHLPRGNEAGRFRSAGLRSLENGILRAGAPPIEAAGAIDLIAARDPSHEVEIWARTIDRWIRLDGDPVRPGEIAVVVRDIESYRPIVEETFPRYGIPFFVDRHIDLSSRPLVRAIRGGLDVLQQGWSREAVIPFLRSPLLDMRGGEIDLLENLSLESGRDFDDFHGEDWPPLQRAPRVRYLRSRTDEDGASAEENGEETEDRPERDDGAEERDEAVERVRAAIANRLRARFAPPLRRFEMRLQGGPTGREAVASLRAWIAESGIEAAHRRLERSDPASARREWDAVQGVLDWIAGEAGSLPLNLDRFADLLLAGFDSLALERTPTGCDQVTFAEVQRSRLGPVRRAIVGGLSAEGFPRPLPHGRFFNERERALLASLGMVLGTPDSLRQEEEAYFFYIAITRASERLLLTRPATDFDGKSLEPSPYLVETRRQMPDVAETTPPIEMIARDLSDLSRAQTGEELAARVGAYIAARLDRRVSGRPRDPEKAEIEAVDRGILSVYNHLLLAKDPAGGGSLLEPSRRLWGYDNRPALPQSLLRRAIGWPTLTASASRLQTFARCPYQHFAKSLLKLQPRPTAQVSPLETGSLAHRALELLYKEGLPSADRKTTSRRLTEILGRIVHEENLRAFLADPTGEFRVRSCGSQILRFLDTETARQRKSEFRPHAFEEAFGTKGAPPLRIELTEETSMLLRGRIDRIDLRETGIRKEALVIDYKSALGKRRGSPADLRDGWDLQLGVYLLVVEDRGWIPAAALYAPVLPPPRREEDLRPDEESENPLKIRLRGIVPMSRIEDFGGLEFIQKTQSKVETLEELVGLLAEAKGILARLGRAILSGRIDVSPAGKGGKSACEHCDFAALCRVDDAYNPSRWAPTEGFAEEEISP